MTDVQLDDSKMTVSVAIEFRGEPCCPKCGKSCAGYDSRVRTWRHLDSCQYKTLLVASIPRVQCQEHGVVQLETPWAQDSSRFTALFERVVIEWLKEANFSAVARRMKLSWDEVDGIMSRAIARGLARRETCSPTRIGVDETSFQKRHEYVTVVTNIDNSTMIAVMDMWPAYINAVTRHLPNAKIAFDRSHIAKHLGDAVNAGRSTESSTRSC